MENQETLAVDIGGPILNAKGGSSPQVYAAAPPTKGAFRALRKLSLQRFYRRIYLISQCNEEIQAIKLSWMLRHDFYSRSGIIPGHVRFVRKPEEKAVVCKEVGATHYVDDRPSIVAHAIGIVPNLFLFRPDPAELGKHPELMLAAREVEDWKHLLPLLLP